VPSDKIHGKSKALRAESTSESPNPDVEVLGKSRLERRDDI
jgi:hypothetical protein